MIGRREECNEIKRRLGPRQRLVTLTGPGGVGKSVLARAAAADLERSHPDGTWVVDLAGATDPALLGMTLAGAAGVHLHTGEDDLAQLADVLADRRALLVLDGCDALLEATSATVATLLARCPDLHVLATCRQPLMVPGESVLQVGPLSCPDPDDLPGLEGIKAYDAVTLFVERASTLLPSFTLDDDNAAAVARLCAALGGMPLAVELAAARILVLSPQAMLERMGDRYRLLSKGSRGAPAHLSSLRASVDASFALCSDEERVLWSRMAVFPGTFDLEAVEAVCSGEGIEVLDVLDLVDSLLEKSVLAREEGDGAQVRYRMPETLRSYGLEKLDPGEADGWVRRHLDWCARLVEESMSAWFGPGQAELVGRLRQEHANLRAALEVGTAEPELAETGARMCAALEPYWVTTGRVSEARHWLERALRPEGGDPSTRAAALATAVWFAVLQSDLTSAAVLLERADAVRDEADVSSRAALLRAEAGLELWRSGADPAVQLLTRAEALSRSADDVSGVAAGSFLLGLVRVTAADRAGAAEALAACVALTEPIGEAYLRSYALGLLALLSLDDGDLDTAAATERDALRLKLALGDRFAQAFGVEALALVAAARGTRDDQERAAILLGAAGARWRALGADPTDVPGLTGRHAEGAARLREALGDRVFDERVRRGAGLTPEQAVGLALDEEIAEERSSLPESDSPLTPRELEVAELVGRGLSNKEIADTLVISHRTAQGHVENILRKLGFGSRTQVAAWIVERHARTGTGA